MSANETSHEYTPGSVTPIIFIAFAVQEVFVKDLNIDYSSVLGSGTFGTVCKGNWAGSEVAIKAISSCTSRFYSTNTHVT
jgi:hypothetical protein